MQATYAGRGWCYEESCISNLVKSSALVLDLGLFSGTKTDIWDVIAECRAGREPPHSPGAAPKLQSLRLDETEVSEEAKQALRDAREGLMV